MTGWQWVFLALYMIGAVARFQVVCTDWRREEAGMLRATGFASTRPTALQYLVASIGAIVWPVVLMLEVAWSEGEEYGRRRRGRR